MPAYVAYDMDVVLDRILSHYRSTYVALPGAAIKEPAPAIASATPTDWIAVRMLRNESRAFTIENDQRRTTRAAIYMAFQPGRGGFTDRFRTIEADLADAFNLSRTTNGNAFTGTFSYLGESAPPPNFTPSHEWDWHAIFFDADFTGAPS